MEGEMGSPAWIDKPLGRDENLVMKTKEDLLTTEAAADAQAVIEHALTGKLLDPAIAQRVRARSERATEELRRRFGKLDSAVALVREVRDTE